jgi:hypothetical protein
MVSRASHRVLESALGALLPTADEILLLRASLLGDARGREAWRQFTTEHAELTELFRTDKGELRRLGPLLSQGLKSSDAQVDARLWTVLRTGRMREGLRAKIYEEVLQATLSTLSDAAVPCIVFRGAAVGALAYGDLALRHSHDVDLLVAPGLRERAAAALTGTQFARDVQRVPEGGRRAIIELTHPTSLPVRLHGSLLEFVGYESSLEALEARARNVMLAGMPARALAPEDALLQTLAHASYSSTRHTLQWATDAWMLLATSDSLNWNAFAERVVAMRVALPVYTLLRFLAERLDATVPRAALDTLGQAASQHSTLERDWALYGARAGARRGLGALFTATPALRDRFLLAGWLLKPSAEYVAWTEGTAMTVRSGGVFGRVWRYAGRRVSRA